MGLRPASYIPEFSQFCVETSGTHTKVDKINEHKNTNHKLVNGIYTLCKSLISVDC